MAMEAIRPYFKTHLNALGFKEWKDAFNVSNIPSTLVQGSYHVLSPGGQRRAAYNQQDQGIIQNTQVRVFYKGYRSPADAVDAAMLGYNTILTRVLAPENRLGVVVKNVFFDSMNIQPIDATNDNAAILEINFSCLIILST